METRGRTVLGGGSGVIKGVEQNDVEDKGEVFRLKSGTGPTVGCCSTPVISGLLDISCRRVGRLRGAAFSGKHSSWRVLSDWRTAL